MVCLSLRLASWNVSSKISSPSWRWQFLRLAAPRGSGDRRVTSSPWLSVQQVPCHAKKQVVKLHGGHQRERSACVTHQHGRVRVRPHRRSAGADWCVAFFFVLSAWLCFVLLLFVWLFVLV